VLPAFNEEAVVEKAASAIFSAFEMKNIEIVLVDDGSTDSTWDKIKKMNKENPLVRGIRFTRNFGKESAIRAGLNAANGECAIVMDSDLQFPPKAAVEMFSLWASSDLSIVEGVKIKRQSGNIIYKLGSSLFYKFLRRFAGLSLKNSSDFKLLDRQAIDLYIRMPERQSFFRAITGWTGMKTQSVHFLVEPRAGGTTKWSWIKLVRYAVSSIASYTTLPMQLVTFAGFGFLLFAVALAVQTLFMKITGNAAGGFTTVIVLLLLIGSILMISIGIIGVYIAKIYDEVKFRPRYIVAESAGEGAKKDLPSPDRDFLDILAGRKGARDE
jgi:dolichol-phosphate mannosyltransferase